MLKPVTIRIITPCMSKYAVVEISGHQYQISEGEVVDLLGRVEKPQIKVVLFVDGSTVLTDKKDLEQVNVKASIQKIRRARKITVGHFKAKSKYDKTRGYRETYSQLQVERIGIGVEKEAEKVEKTEMKPVESKKASVKVSKKVATPEKTAVAKKTVSKKLPVKKVK